MKIKSASSIQISSPSATGAQVDHHDEEALHKWCLILGVTKEELLEAIRLHGNQIKDIRRGMREKKKDEAA